MNKTNGYREHAGASTSLYKKEQTKSNTSQRATSGLSFLKWFKKNDKSTIDSRCSTKSIDRNFHGVKHHYHFSNNSHETLSPSSSPNFEYLSPSSSCDSIKSTSTTGFAFIKPTNYRPSNGITHRTFSSHDIEDTASYQTFNEPKPDLTIRRKYCLYDADTLTSTEDDLENVRFRGDRSLPHLRKKWRDTATTSHQRKRTRRTVSDSCKDKKSGAYVHVKGKRKAPPPPETPKLANGTVCREAVNKSTSTLSRKKRKAPPPPYSPPASSGTANPVDQSFTLEFPENNMDLKALLRSSAPSGRTTDMPEITVVRASAPPMTVDREDFTAAQKLTEQQKQAVLDNIVRVTQSASSSDTDIVSPPPTSPISPRPWYKRPISSHRDSSIPFKREVVLKTMEKRKSKQKEKSSKADSTTESTHSRSSIFEASSKFGFFLRGKDSSEKDKEKRRSGIGIPNISELDREAAEIVNREYASVQAAEKTEKEKFFSKSDHILLQQEMFGSKTNIEISSEACKDEDEPEEVVKSAKDLISKFEASSNAPRVTLNTSFIGRKDNFVKQDSKDSNTSIGVSTQLDEKRDLQSKPPLPSKSEQQTTEESLRDIHQNKPINKPPMEGEGVTKISWTCAFCTLENPGWRIICEVCERIKPYDKRTSIENKVNQNNKAAFIVSTKEENLTQNLNNQMSKSEQLPDWDKKTEKVLKYFLPKTGNNSPLSKSSSETSVAKQQFLRKSVSSNKPPSGSPQFGLRNRIINTSQPDIMRPSDFASAFKSSSTSTIPEEKENLTPSDEQKRPLIDSSVIVTTVTPVFYASATLVKNSDVAIVGETRKETQIDPKIVAEPSENNAIVQNDHNEIIYIGKDNPKEQPNESNTVDNILLNAEPKIDIVEVRKARLAKFTVPQIPSLETEPIPIRDHDSLEREKKRLRDMIQAMNAKALAEKPTNANNNPPSPLYEEPKAKTSPSEIRKHAEPKPSSAQTGNDQVKLGAIKKVFAKTRFNDPPKKTYDPDPVKPKKVSTSAQTTAITKKSLTPEDFPKQPLPTTKQESVYANVPIYENSPLEKYDRNVKLTENDKAKVQQISQQLTSVQGINDFKESLKNAPRGISATDTLALNKIMRNLETAIAEGQHELAAQIAIDLARMKVSLHVTKQKDRPISRTDMDFDKNIIVDMFVEDKYSQKGPIQIAITPLFTIAKLKQKIAIDFDIPVGVQRWLINDDLALDDEKTLLEFGVKDQSATFYLYIIAPDIHFYEVKKTNVDKNQLLPKIVEAQVKGSPEKQTMGPVELGAVALPIPRKPNEIEHPETGWVCNLCTLINHPDQNACIACTKPKPKEKLAAATPVKKPTVQLRQGEKKNDLNKINPNRKSTDIFNIVDIKIDVKKTVTDQIKNVSNAASPNITRNKYRGVDNFNPNRKKGPAPKPGANKQAAIKASGNASQNTPSPKKDHYLELLSLDNTDVVTNVEEFECPICFMKFNTGQGVILRDCLHTFCKECLAHTVQYSEDAEVKCPYMDAEYSCDSVLQEREVRAVVSKNIYELHLVKSMRVAEHQIENAFHCKTPNCRGWCIYEDNVNEFKCPVCRITNCLTCRVIHDGLTCKQYQDRLNSDCDSNIEARRTKEMLEEMLKNGEAMNCPTCQVIMMKKWGCDWLKCSMCKTEVCWVTRGPRWGPGGKGDTSAGCRCGVDNIKCHPKCNYCH